MARNLAPSKHELIYDMIHSGELSISQMVQAAGCNRSTILRISSDVFFEWCVDIVSEREKSAEGHFRHAGLAVEEE